MSDISFGETKIREKARLGAEYADVLDKLREGIAQLRHVHLTYVSYDDRLSDEQVDAYLSGDFETLYGGMEEWESDQRYEYAKNEINELLAAIGSEDFPDFDSLEPEDADELRWAIEEKDESDPIRDLARNTLDQLFRVTIARPNRAWYIFDDAEYAKAQAWVAGQLYGVGVPLLPAARIAGDLLNECGDWIHDGHTLDVIWHGDIETVAGVKEGDRLTFTDPHILLLDRMNGSGYEEQIDFEVTVEVGEDRIPHLDRTGWGYGWDDVAGVYSPAYGTTLKVTKEETD